MKHLKTIWILTLILSSVNAFAHKDRIERAEIYVLYFGKERVEIRSSEKEKLESYNDIIISKKKELTHADLVYTTGEVISFDFKNHKCKNIEIEFMKRTLVVPPNQVSKISGVNLFSVSLLWSGEKPHAFDSKYFYIKFSVGKTDLPYIELSFEDNKFIKALIWSRVDTTSSQWKKL